MTTNFEPSTFKISFLVGDIISSKLSPTEPLPLLTLSENEQLRSQLLLEISWLREFGAEGSKTERTLIDRVQESLDNDDCGLDRVEKDKDPDVGTRFAFTDLSGITMVLRLKNLTDERLLDIYAGIGHEVVARRLDVPEDALSPAACEKPISFLLATDGDAVALAEEMMLESKSDSGSDAEDGVFHELEGRLPGSTPTSPEVPKSTTKPQHRRVTTGPIRLLSIVGISVGIMSSAHTQVLEYVSAIVGFVKKIWESEVATGFQLTKKLLDLFMFVVLVGLAHGSWMLESLGL